ncbi:MAG: aryl-sulfate sulfotransferase [Gemmatimonadetes bacterium]|nr:aryl-sulfate sulfotransferase [Gemmatimonadota bacterium]
MRAIARRSIVPLLWLAACGRLKEPTALPLPSALDHVVVDSVAIGARLDIGVSAATRVQVRYWTNEGDAPLEVVASLSPSDSEVVLTRLAHGRTYQFAASALTADGRAGPATAGQFTTPALPADLANMRFDATGSATDPLLMLEVRGTDGFNGFVAIDTRGEVVWYYRTEGVPQGSTRRANGNFILNDLGHGLREVTPNGDVVHTMESDATGIIPHHDVIATPSNTLLFIAHDERVASNGASIAGEAIWEWAPESGALQKRWSAWDWLDPSTDWGDLSYDGDWLHGNSLSMGPHGNVLISFNFLSQVVSIAPDFSRVEWRLGGARSDFALDTGTVFSGQHSVTEPAEGHVLMFDNGRARQDGAKYTRGLELQLDTVAHRATTAWEFRPAAAIFAPYLGTAQRLANGNTVLFFGTANGPFADQIASGPISGYEVTPAGTVVWHLDVGNALSVYRGTPLPSIGGEKDAP